MHALPVHHAARAAYPCVPAPRTSVSQLPACVSGSIPMLIVGKQHAVPCLQVSWQRVRVANWLAHSGEEWVRLLDTLNSGTYNNQYMARLAAACL